MTLFANRGSAPGTARVNVTHGPVSVQVEENVEHVRSFWGQLGRLLEEIDKENRVGRSEVEQSQHDSTYSRIDTSEMSESDKDTDSETDETELDGDESHPDEDESSEYVSDADVQDLKQF